MLGFEICLSNDSKSVVGFLQRREVFSVSHVKMKHCLFGMYSFLTHGHFSFLPLKMP